MKKQLIITSLLLAFFISPIVMQAQQWSAEQKEVWKAANGWWDNAKAQNLKALIDMTHKDYKGWGFDDNFPSGKSDLIYWVNNVLPKRRILHTSLKPLEILVNGNTAVLHYYYTQTAMMEEKEKNISGRWTDIWVKQGGKWMLYADSGGQTSDDDDDDD